MSEPRTVLILFPEGGDAAPSSLQELINAVADSGARVQTHACDNRYDEVLDAVEQADVITFWR